MKIVEIRDHETQVEIVSQQENIATIDGKIVDLRSDHILSWVKNIILLLILNVFASSSALASDRLTGQHMLATKYFLQKGLNLSLLVSDKRTFSHVPFRWVFVKGMPMTGAQHK